MTHSVPDIRIQAGNDAPVDPDGDFILYWMIANRRMHWNFSLQRAVEWAQALNKPLVVLEALRASYPWASDRLHRFVLDGMADNAWRFANTRVLYYPYVESVADEGQGLLEALAARACVIVTDDFPCFFLPRMVAAAAQRIAIRLEKVDSNGLLPLRAANSVFTTAHSFRRFLQKILRPYLYTPPNADPLAEAIIMSPPVLPTEITSRWPKASPQWLERHAAALTALPIDHSVRPTDLRGGERAAQAALKEFLDQRLARYAEGRNQPEENVTSGLSPYLHFGQISVHQIFAEVMKRENWSVDELPLTGQGKRSGWWGVSPAAEAFLDELITWRELGYNMCWQRADYDRYESLPEWSLETLARHAPDHRSQVYTLDEFEKSRTHDPLWNAAQRQLVREGRIHNYLRMLWGKKILEWSRTPPEALAVMIELNNKFGLDGRNPNTYSGIFWCLGRYDRPWGPERPIFGTVRYMSSDNTARKVRVKNYIQKYLDPSQTYVNIPIPHSY